MLIVITGSKRLDSEVIQQTMVELSTGSDRSVAIVGGSLVETVLENRLKQYLIQDKEVSADMFRMSGPLGTFAAKIQIGKLVGFYGDEVHKELMLIKNVRNKFAHELQVRDFASQPIANWCQNFKLCDRYTIDNAKPDETVVIKGSHPKDFPYWFGIHNRDETLRNPRGRFVTSVSAVLYAMSISDRQVPPPAI